MRGNTIADFITNIKNAYLARHKSLEIAYTKMFYELGKILKNEGFIEDMETKTIEGRKILLITLLYKNRKPALADIKQVSKPGLRLYVRRRRIPYVYGGLGVAILSTPAGIMTGRQARAKNLGGEVICKIW